ncbi:phage tail terminator family protein [Anaerosporobacter sp.]
MITIKDIYKAVNNVIESEYPTIPIVSKEVVEGADKPYYYVQILPTNLPNTSINYKEARYSVVITYFPEQANSIKDIEVFERLQLLFGHGIKIDNVFGIISNYDMDYIGQDDNILQCSFTLSYTEYFELSYEEQVADEVTINNSIIEE